MSLIHTTKDSEITICHFASPVHYIYYPGITFITRALDLLTVHYIYYPGIIFINRALDLLTVHYIYYPDIIFINVH